VQNSTLTTIVVGIITSAIGFGYIRYGMRQTKFAPLLSGVALCAYSYFIDSWLWLCVLGALLLIVPFIIDV